MKNFIIQNWFKISILLLILTAFYWYGLRPARIKTFCYNYTKNPDSFTAYFTKADEELQDWNFKECLEDKGL